MTQTNCTIKRNASVYDLEKGTRGTTTKALRAEIVSEKFGVYTVNFKGRTLKVDYKFIEKDN